MARYIDADKFKSNLEKAMEKMHLIGGVKGVDVAAVITALDRQPTADVVPRTEVEEYKHNWQKIHDSYNADCIEHYNKGRAVVVREIFAELESKIKNDMDDIAESINSITDPDAIDGQYEEIATLEWVLDYIVELKKKYEENQT